MSCLQEKPEVLLKTDSITDLKNTYQTNYKDTRIIVTEIVPVFFFSLTLNMFLFSGVLSERTTFSRVLSERTTQKNSEE